jgi:tRNA pseudouridine38-40 synthase
VNARVGPDQHRIRLTLHYDGGGFAGWQLQPGRRTVQGELEVALTRLTRAPAIVVAAGRTDSGVHATGQVVGALVAKKWTAEELQRALNAVLPRDIWIAAAAPASDTFHARYDAVARGYAYRVGTTPISRSPFRRRWCWSLGYPLATEPLNDAAARFTGEHSFRAFAKSGQPERGERCTVHVSEWREQRESGLVFHVVANRFLHHMVRYMVSTMVDIARGRREAGDIDRLLAGDATVVTSGPAPPEGLYLARVYYEGDNRGGEDTIDEVFS